MIREARKDAPTKVAILSIGTRLAASVEAARSLEDALGAWLIEMGTYLAGPPPRPASF